VLAALPELRDARPQRHGTAGDDRDRAGPARTRTGPGVGEQPVRPAS
jgi:hypothetical protein